MNRKLKFTMSVIGVILGHVLILLIPIEITIKHIMTEPDKAPLLFILIFSYAFGTNKIFYQVIFIVYIIFWVIIFRKFICPKIFNKP